jgi:hypothetical protein
MGYAARLSPEAKRAEHLSALRRAARALKTPEALEGYLALAPTADRDAMRDILTPLCPFSQPANFKINRPYDTSETPRG